MTVYIVIAWYRSEQEILAVFSSTEKAEKYISDRRHKHKDKDVAYEIEKYWVDLCHNKEEE